MVQGTSATKIVIEHAWVIEYKGLRQGAVATAYVLRFIVVLHSKDV